MNWKNNETALELCTPYQNSENGCHEFNAALDELVLSFSELSCGGSFRERLGVLSCFRDRSIDAVRLMSLPGWMLDEVKFYINGVSFRGGFEHKQVEDVFERLSDVGLKYLYLLFSRMDRFRWDVLNERLDLDNVEVIWGSNIKDDDVWDRFLELDVPGLTHAAFWQCGNYINSSKRPEVLFTNEKISNLNSLRLNSVVFDAACLEPILDWDKSNLLWLGLHDNALGNQGLSVIQNSVLSGCLQRLDVGLNMLSLDGVVLRGFESMEGLRYLDLSGNLIGNEQIDLLMSSDLPWKLKVLNVLGNYNITKRRWEELLKSDGLPGIFRDMCRRAIQDIDDYDSDDIEF